MPKLDRNAAFNEAFGSEPKLDRAEAEKLAEDGGGLADAGREFVRGTYQLADSTMGMIDRGFVGDLMRAMKGKPTSRDVDPIVTNFLRLPKAEQERISSEYLNAGTPMQDAQAYFKNAADEWAKKRSPSLQAAEDYTQQGDGVVDIVTRYAEEPSALAGALIRNLPQMLPMLAVRKAPISAQANIGGVYQGAVGAQQARDQSLTDAKQSGASATDTVNAAQTAEDVGGAVSTLAGLVGARGDVAALNAITGRTLAPILSGGKKELLKQPALNAVEEFIDEAGSPLGANIGAKQTYDHNRAVMDNVVNQGMHGALIGGPMGIAHGASMAFGKREQTPETAAANADALVSAINNAVGPIVQTRDTLKTQVDDLANQVKAFDEASANGQLNAADIARKQALLQELAAKQTELSAVETQAQDAAIIASNDALKQYAQAGEVPDFNAMGERLGINPDDLLSLYDQHSTSIKQQQAATDTRNKVADFIEANDTEGAQAFLEQNGFKQDQADVIMGDAMKSIAAKNKEANAKKAAEAKQQAKLDAETKLRAERDSELAAILKAKPDASFANDVLPILQKKYKLQSGSEALAVWNEAKKQSKAAPVDQQADAAEVTDEERLNAKKAIYSAYKDTGYPDDSAALSVSNVQNKANEKGVPFNVWRAEGGTLAVVPASQKSPVTNGKLIGTIHPESKATADEQTHAIDNTQAIADELAQHIETKTRPDFIGLGKKYSAKPLDLDKQYREMLRVKKEQSKTVPPVAPVPNEAAPIVPPQPKQKAADRPIDPEKDSLLVALAKIGGLSRDEAISHGVDKAMLGHRPIFGKLLFRTDGKSFDSAAEALAQDNYPVFEDDQYNDAGLHGGNGRSHTGKALLLALTDALNGNDIGTPQYYVAKAQKAFEEEQEQARIDALFDGKGNSKADWLDDVSDAIVDELIENPSTATQEVIEVIQNDAGTETQDVADNSTQEAGQQDNEGSAATSSRETTSQSEGGGREGTGGGKTDTKSIADNYKDFPVVAFHPTYGEIIEVPTTRGVNVRISRAEVERNISPTVKTFTKDGKLKEELHVLGNTLIGDKPLTDTAQQTKDMKEAGWTVAQKPSTRIQEFKLMQEGYSSYVPDGKGGFQEVGNDGFVWAKPPQKTTTGQQIADTKAPTPMSERANGHKAHIETDDGKHIYEGTTGDSSFHYLWNEDAGEVSLYRVKLIKNKDTGVVEGREISIFDPSTGKQIGTINSTGNKNLTDSALIISSINIGSAVQHYAQDPATLTQSERDANVKDLTQKALAVRIKLQEQKIAMGEEMGVSKAKREKEQAELDRLKGLLTPKAPTTNGQQIAEALDATATAIGAAAHQSAINRFKKEGGLTYRNPAAIEQVQKDERYNVEINTDGHAVVKGIKDGDAWVGVAPESQTERKEAQEIGDAEFDERMKELGYQEQEQIIEHVTAKGKTIRGVVRMGITKDEAKKIDEFTFAKNGGFFIREKYLTKADPAKTVNFKKITSISDQVDAWLSLKAGDSVVDANGNRLGKVDFVDGGNLRLSTFKGSKVFTSISSVTGDSNVVDALNSRIGKQPESKMIEADFSLKDNKKYSYDEIVDTWENIKQGDTVITKDGQKLIAEADAAGKSSISFKRQDGSSDSLSINYVTGLSVTKAIIENRINEQLPEIDNVIKHLKNKGVLVTNWWMDTQSSLKVKSAIIDLLDNYTPDSTTGRQIEKMANILLTQVKDTGITNDTPIKQPEQTQDKPIKKDNGPYYGDGYSSFNKGQPRTLPSHFTSATGTNPKNWLKGWDAAKAEQAQNNEPAPVKQPEAKTESKGKVDFSVSFIKTEDAVDLWQSIKKGDTVITRGGQRLVAQTDVGDNLSIRFKRQDGSTEALGVSYMSGDTRTSGLIKARLQEKNKKKLIGKNSEGKDLYEDGRGVRFTDNGRGVQVGEDVSFVQRNEELTFDTSNRTDEHRTVEEVAARQPKPQPKEEKPAPKQPSANTIFTEDAAAAARERLKKKLGGNRLNSGFDPEILQDGLILAGYHIEKGARTFAAFAKAIVEDMGDVVKPYIKSWYMGVKYDPRAANFDGMSSAAEVDSADIEAILKVSSQQPATPAPTAKGEIVDDYDENDLDASDGTEGWKYGGYIFGDDDVSYGVGYREIRKVKNNGTQVTIRQIRIYDENRASYMAVWEHESSKITDGILDGFSIDTAKFHFSMSDATENAFSNDATDGDALWTRFGREITDSIKYEMSREPKPNKAPKDKIGLPSPKQPTDKGDSNESQGNGSNSTRPLENVLPEGNQPTGKEGNTTTGGRGIGGANTTRNGRSNAGRSNRSGGVAAGQDSMDFEQPTQLDEQELAEEAEKVEDKTLPGQPRTPKKLTGVNPGNYRITEADKIGTGTPGERLKQNLEAIRLVRKLQEEGRYATKEEQAVLAKYVGWGGLANAFDEASKQKQYREANAELKRLLSPEEYTEALVSTQNAHYTSPKVIKAMYDLVRHLGFMGGNVLEPTVGSGNFIGLMPEDFAASSNWYAAELDPITGALAQYLYPEGQVMAGTGFQDAEFAYGKFDLAIGNPPFGDTRITDTNKARKHLTRMKIHNYIISKSGMHLRPGGVMAMVITHRFLDAKDDEARAELAKNFRFVGALRLPNTAFKENANTEVTTDIVIFQRLKPGEEATTNLEWLDTSAILKNDKGQDIRLNGYFAKHPKMMLGNPTLDGTLYAGGRGDEFTLEAIPGMDLEQAIADRIKTNLADQAGTMDNSAEYLEAASAGNMVNRADVGIGGFLFEGGKLSMRESDDANGNPVFVVLTPSTQWTEKTELGQKRYDRIIGMLHLRQQTIEMIALEMADAPIKLLDKHRALLNKSYDAFVKEHGFLADPANSKLMDGDIGLEFGLENSYQKALSVARAKATGMKPKPASAKKADILSRRVFTPHKVVTSADSARDGYLISLSEHGKLDIPYISELTGKTIKQVTDELSSGETPLIFMNPKTEKWEQHDEYLSGNVKVKHQEAVRAGLETNAKALEAVFPEDVKPNDLHITVRSGWLPVDHFVQFLDLLGVKNSKVSINAFTGTMFVTRGDETANALSEEFKNEDYDISEMLTNLANGRVLTAYDREPDGNGGYKRVVNKDRTAILSIQSKKMKELFNDWMRLDDGRMQEAAKAFNEKMNTHSTREYNGAKMLVTVGASPSIKLLNTQKNAAWRMIQSPVILLDHVVGAGKTFTLITGIMERRRLGLSRKPAMVVPNHLVGQWAKDFYALYPAAKLLAISEKDFAKSNRQRLFARMATGNFDCIIMGHSSLKFIQVSAATESKMINEEIAYLEKALAVASDSEDKRTVKSLANQISKKKERFKALADIKRDTLVEWEQMGIDYLGVDESHEFKNLEYSTSMQRVTGMNDPKGSQRAFDLYMKIRELRARGGGVAFATGTPISNSLVEMYTVLRYLNREELKSRGNDVFDAWVGTYGEVDSRIEYTATQKLKSRNVLARFGNLPELLQLYNEVADTVTMTNLKEIYAEQVRESNKLTGENKSEKMPIPPVKDGGRQLDVGNLTAAQSEYMDYLVARAESIEEQGGKNDPKIDNLLWISNDARKMSLDMRLVDPMAQDSPDSKVNRAANNIKRIYDDTHANKGTQLVFCDLSTPKKGADKEGKKIIKAALEKLGLDNDSRFARMMEDETLQIQWRMIMDRADNIIEDENTDDATRERIEDWLDKLDSDIEGILLTADSGFSVYDALKQTLVDKGIPENEIAFIHDYNSRDQKTELFGLVNDGSIRVLLGSSPKMGAGTNVQKRLVALHHMDAPWRPSDVEQREGRIIRQGNLFATPPSAENPNPLYDPNFEVEIKAYSTNRTFDTVMWQTLQRKAAMIEQFRSGEREMVEPNGDAAGYAEFMAQSTGNPAFKRKIEIEGELNGLQAQKRSYMARQGEASRFLEHYDQAKARALKSLEGHKDGSINSATYNGKTYANDYEAARLAEEAIYREEFDQWEIDDKEHGPLLLDYIKLSEEQKATAKKPKTPKKPAYPTIASKRMQAKSEWSQMVAKMMEEAEKNGEAKAKIYGDKELKLYREESNGEKTEWYLELGNVDIAYSISKTPNVGTIETGFMPNVMVNNLFRHRKNAENRIAELEESKPIAERVLAKPFPDQEKLESMEKEYEVVKDEVDSLAWSESKRRSLQVNRYIAGDKERQLTVKGGIDLVKHGNWRVIEKTINTKGKESVTTWVVVNKGDGAYKGQPTNNFATKQEAIAWAEKEQLENDPEGKPSPTRSAVNKTERMPPVKYEVTENGNAYEVRQPASPSSRMSQINLFATPLPNPTADDNQRQAAGNFAVNIESVEQGRIKSVPGKVTDSKGAASILREFGNRAQETFLVLMLDENNKPIEVARHSIGNATSSIVDIGLVVGSIASNPKARTVYFGHNHPSGNAAPSQADKNITEKLKEFTDLIGVDFGGHVVMGENGYSLIKDRYDVLENIDYQPATNSRNSVPVTERIITARSKDKPMEASSPQAAESIVEKIDQDGLILLNSQNKVMGFIAITPQEMANLKGNPALVRKMFSDWSKAGADSTIIVTTSAQNEAADNISNALMSTGTMRVLDHFYKNSSGKYLSRRNLATFRPQEGPYFSRESTKPNQVPIYRIDGKDFDAKKIKPHGLYVSIPDDASTFESPHKEVGDTSFSGYASPKNPLNVESIKIQHKRGNNYPMETSAGVSALHQLVDKPLFDSLIKADKKELIATIKEQFPDIDTSQYHDAYELLEVLGAQLAIQDGYDAIIQKVEGDPMSEMVILDNAIIGSMSPLKSSTTEGGGLTVAQVRATLVDHFGEKTVKALEDKGLIVIYANVSAVPKQFDAKQGDQGFYDPNTGITHLIAENLNPETVLPTMLHEMSGHKGFQTMLDPKLYDALMGTFNRLVAAGNPIAIEAQRRAEEAETNKATQEMEYLPYLLTVAQQELQATNLQKSAITKLINRIISAVRAFAFEKLGVRLELTPSDMVALAERMIKALATQGVTTNEITVQPRVNDIRRLIKNVLSKGKERLSPSKEFMSVIDKAVNAEESNDARKEAPNIVSRFIGEMEKEVLELSQKTGEIGFRKTQDSPRLTVDAKEAAEQAEKTLNILKAHRKEIEDGIVFAVSAVESITGYKVKDLMVMMKKHSTIELLQGKKDSTNVDNVYFVTSSVSRVGRTIIKVNLNAQVLVDLTSKSTAIRASGINTIAHELTHLLQFERKNEQMVEPLGIDSFIPEGVASLHKTWLGEHYQVEEGGTNYKAEQEAFSVGYTAAKAMLKKEGLPLRIISESDLENMLLASARSATSVQQALYRFDKANYGQDIRFSRASNGQPSPSPTNPKLDRLLHGIGPGEKLYNALAQPIHKWLDDHSSSQWKLVNNMSPAFKQMMREYLRDQKASEEQTKNIVENGIAMSADERNLLSDVLEKMVASGTTIPQHIVQVAAAMRSALSGQTDELVRLGMLSEGSAERWRDTYLPRLYDKAAKDPINKALAKRLNIVGDHLKGRGIFREVEEKLEAKYEKLGWENRGKGKKGHVIMWRDYTYEERVKMGEIRDALHRFATGFLSTQRDIATGRLLEKIADNPDLASVDPVAGWTLVPTATIKETGGVKRYGKLSGMYVHPDVWENTKHYIDDRDGLMEFYRQTLSVWKQGKTALNVVAHMNNVVSNAVMVTAAGANMADVARGYDSIMKEDQYYKEAKELGMFASGHFTGDIRDYFGGEIQDATTPSNFVFKAFKAAWRNKGFEFMRKMYDAEDQLFRMSLYRKARELGATQAESIDYAETFMFNYADLPAGIKKIRDFGLPFISYTYKAVPAVTRLAFTQPHRVLALVGMVYAFNAIAYAMLGADADEDKERKNLPDYMQGYSAWGVPKLVRLPWNDGEKAAFLDVYRWAPLGDFFAIGNRTGGADMPTWAMMSGPYWSFYNTMIQNRNGLTGKNYLEDTDTDRQVFFKRMKFGLSEWVPMYYHVDKNLNAIRNALGDNSASRLLEGMGYTGTDMRGDPSELKNSLLGATGIKVRKLDMDDQQQRKLVALKSEMLDRVRQMRRIQRDKSNPYRERDIAAQKEEIKRIKEKAQEIRKQ